jgi:putative ABC transport system permease protein
VLNLIKRQSFVLGRLSSVTLFSVLSPLMHRIAIRSLMFDRGKLIAALLGVALATTLAFVQIGLYRGFQVSSSTVIEHIGGDFWVVPKGIEVIDNAETLSVAPRNLLLSQPCVADVRGVVYGFVLIRKPQGTRDTALIVGTEARAAPQIPWILVAGSRDALKQPLRVSVDRTDLAKLQLPAAPLGKAFEVNGQKVVVGAMTNGIRSFTLSPYLFTSINNARRLTGLIEGQVSYFSVKLTKAGCRDALLAWADKQNDFRVLDTGVWKTMTENYWVNGSGAGLILGFTALLGLIVGAVIVGQTLYSMTKEHLMELATLKAVGAKPRELAGFVLWQVAFLALIGGGIGLAAAVLIARALAASGLTVVLNANTVTIGIIATVIMCAVASLTSLRTVLRVEAAAVLK